MKDVFDEIDACETDIAVRAGAGTGKTTALVRKYLSELIKPRAEGYYGVDRIAAITFTEKAAAEMSARVREELTRNIETLGMELDEKDALDGSAANLAEDGPDWTGKKKLLAHLIRQRQALNSAYISTIHSFCARMLWESPYTAGVDPSFTVIDAVTAAETLGRCVHTVLLNALRGGASGVKKLVRDFGFSSKGPFTKGLKETLLDLIPLMRVASRTPAALRDTHARAVEELGRGKEEAREALQNLLPELLRFGASSKERKTADALAQRPELSDPAAAITPLAAGKALKMAADLEKAVKGRTTFKDGRRNFEPSLRAARLMETFYGAALERELLNDTTVITRLLEDIMAAYDREKRRRAALDFEDLEEKTRDLLRRSPGTLDIYRRRFARTLIDEFQDTNELQREIITALAPPGEGRLFIVGDVKQSIYGFRGSDPWVFLRTTDEITAAGGAPFALTDCHRSLPALVSFTNEFFAALMDGGDGGYAFDPEADRLTAIRSAGARDTAIEKIPLISGPIHDVRLAEAEAIAAHIGRIAESDEETVQDKRTGETRGAMYGDIAILLRVFTHHEVYEAALRRTGIPYQVVKGRGFYDAQEIRDMATLLSLIEYAADPLSFISTLRSPLAGLSDEALLALCRDENGSARDPTAFIRGGDPVPDSLADDDAERLDRFLGRFRRWRSVRDRLNISELIEMILSETGYGAVMTSRFNGEQYLANVFKLIELARTFEADGARGLKNFTAQLNTLLAAPPVEAKADVTGGDENVVKVMSVHQSKGLEFPIVFLADLGSGRPPTTSRILFHAKSGPGLKHYDLDEGEWYAGPAFRRANEGERAAQDDEQKRLLYVAMTRARDRLVFSGPAGSRAGQWLEWVTETIDAANLTDRVRRVDPPEKRAPVAEEPEPGLVKKLLDGYRPDAIDRPEEHPIPESAPSLQVNVTALAAFGQCPRLHYYNAVMETPLIPPGVAFTKPAAPSWPAQRLGTRVHALLELMPLGEGAPPDALETSVSRALGDLPAGERDEALGWLRRAFDSAPLSRLAAVAPEAILRELPMAHKIVEKDIEVTVHGAADLVWFDGDEWNLVDYKYSARPADERHYLFQLKLYAYTLMSVHRMEALNTAVVYLKERNNTASAMRFVPPDMKDLRERIITMARRLGRLEGKPEGEWPMRERAFCGEIGCFFRDRCHE